MYDAIEKMVMGILIVVVAIALFLALNEGTKNTEVAECEGWAEDAERYPDFYITAWQEAQCEFHGIPVDAPVK